MTASSFSVAASIAAVLLVHASVARAGEAEAHRGEAEHEAEHEHHHNHVAIFLGGTTTLGDEHTTRFTVGADYERRLPFAGGRLGAGFLVDSAVGDEVETLLAPFVSVHPFGGLIVLGAVGVSVTGGGHDPHLGLRAQAAYFIHAGTLSIGPAVSLDHVNRETAIVYGLSVGAGL